MRNACARSEHARCRVVDAVLSDLKRALPAGRVLELSRGEPFTQANHAVLLRGSLVASEGAGGAVQAAAPSVLPWLWSPHLRCNAASGAALPTERLWCAGEDGALLVACVEHGGETPSVAAAEAPAATVAAASTANGSVDTGKGGAAVEAGSTSFL